MTRLVAKLEKTRAEIATLRRDRERLADELTSREEAIAEIDRFVAEQAARSGLEVIGFAKAHGVPRSWPALVSGAGVFEALPSANVAPILATLDPERLRDRLVVMLDAEVGDRYGTPRAERAAALEKIDRAIYAAEVAEEAEVSRFEANGIEVQRRPDLANPIVIVLREPSA